MTYSELYKAAVKKLEQANIQPCIFDAGQIFKAVFGFDRYRLAVIGGQTPSEAERNKFLSLVSRRAQHEPLQYLLGEWEFYSLPFKVGEGVLIPRADTEVLVDIALDLIKSTVKPVVADLCSGSGCIAAAIAKSNINAKIYALEKSEQAFEYLKHNIKLNNAENVIAVKDDVLLSEFKLEQLDLIVSNPPYIPVRELEDLQQEVKHEPKMALDGGSDGLNFYRTITKIYKSKLKPNGSIAFEVGYNQANAVADILTENGFYNIKTAKDINGIDRVVYAVCNLKQPCNLRHKKSDMLI